MRAFIMVALAFVVLAAAPGWSQVKSTRSIFDTAPTPVMTREDTLVAIDLLAKKIAAANPKYPDPKKVPIGVLIHVPTAEGPAVFYRTESWQYGQMGCFWHIAAHHLFHKPVLPPAPAPASAGPASLQPEPTDTERSVFGSVVNDWLFPIWALLALVGLSVLAEKRRRERQLDPATHPPVVVGGLSNDAPTALRQVQAATTVRHGTDRNVLGVERGVLRHDNPRKTFIAPMEHGDSVMRNKRFKVGDNCWRVRVQAGENSEPVAEYWYHHCGNRFGEIKSGQFELPEGWEFVPSGVSAHVPQTATVPAEAAEATQSIEQAAARITADRRAQAEINPSGEYVIELLVENGTPTPLKGTVRTTGGNRPRSAKLLKDGRIEMTT